MVFGAGMIARKVAIASLVGTAIESFGYYIYAAAAVLVFNSQFFPKGDRIGRKTNVVAFMPTIGLSTVAFGLLPNYESEWGGAALIATENAPEGKRGLFGSFPQLGSPIGLFAANGVFFLVTSTLGSEALVA